MAEQLLNNNMARISGRIATEFTLSHTVYGEGFYYCEIEVPRLSNSFDRIPVMLSERLLDLSVSHKGEYAVAEGQFRSYNKHEEGRSRLILSVFAREFRIIDSETEPEALEDPNNIYLDGFICKKPNYRKTPLGREIADLLIAVNRPYNKSDYVPVIAWGRNARYAQNLEVGTRLQVWGRIQSRTYQKHVGDQVISHTAYEVSITKMEAGEAAEAGEA